MLVITVLLERGGAGTAATNRQRSTSSLYDAFLDKVSLPWTVTSTASQSLKRMYGRAVVVNIRMPNRTTNQAASPLLQAKVLTTRPTLRQNTLLVSWLRTDLQTAGKILYR